MEQGARAEALACIPAYTPTNWATLATGAWPGTHGAPNWNDRSPTDLPGRRRISTFDSRAITAETIWEAVGRQGLRSLSIAYPGSTPTRTSWETAVAPLPFGLHSFTLAGGCEYTTDPGARPPQRLELRPAVWGNRKGLETEIVVAEGSQTSGAVEDGVGEARGALATGRIAFFALVQAEAGEPHLLIADDRNAPPICSLRPGEWSPWVVRPFATDSSTRPAALRFKLLSLSLQPPALRLVRSTVYPTTGFTEPPELSEELVSAVGPFFEHAAVGIPSDAPPLEETVYEEMEYQVDWIARAAEYLLRSRGWDLLYTHWHFPDNVLHQWLWAADPAAPGFDPARQEKALGVIRRACELSDRLVAGLLPCADENTLLAVVSDHGNSPNRFVCCLGKRLAETGLAFYDKEPRGQPAWDPAPRLSCSRAYPFSGLQVNVNLKGREPEGIVDPKDYEATQEEIIDALYNWREPHSGKRVVALALKRQDASLLGFWGEKAGDVVFVYNSGFAWGNTRGAATVQPAEQGANHGPQIPTAGTDFSSNLAAMIIAGPGVRAGARRDPEAMGYARLVDFVPTLCHLLQVRPPRHSQGAILWDLLQ